jgi:hypothetical protein
LKLIESRLLGCGREEIAMPVESKVEPTMTEVVSGIVADVQKLVSQQLALLRSEVRSDWENAKRALRPMLAGIAFASVGMILLGFTASLALYWIVSPADAEPARLPLWACFGLTALGFLGLGGVLIAAGVRSFQSFNPLPDETAAALENNIKALVH